MQYIISQVKDKDTQAEAQAFHSQLMSTSAQLDDLQKNGLTITENYKKYDPSSQSKKIGNYDYEVFGKYNKNINDMLGNSNYADKLKKLINRTTFRLLYSLDATVRN